MKNFTIKELENLSGVKAHTIRAWEHRYAVLQPLRTEKRTRFYTFYDLQKLLALSLLTGNGCRIARLSDNSDEELQRKLQQLDSHPQRWQRAINELILYMYQLNSECFEILFDELFLAWPSDTVIQDIIYPFLKRVGLLFKGNRLSEEHLAVTIIRKKLHWSIERLREETPNGKVILLFLSGERQLDLLLLYMYYLLKKEGWQVVYLGDDISVKNLEELLALKKVDYLLTYLPKKHSFPLAQLATKMNALPIVSKLILMNLPKVKVLTSEWDNILSMDMEETRLFLTRVSKET